MSYYVRKVEFLLLFESEAFLSHYIRILSTTNLILSALNTFRSFFKIPTPSISSRLALDNLGKDRCDCIHSMFPHLFTILFSGASDAFSVGSKRWFWRRLKFYFLWKVACTYRN